MKLIFMQYLASLKERGELDVIMPDLLSEIGLTVISRPGVGTKQYGVDVAAVGTDAVGNKLFLLSIKPGDLTRSDWNSRDQSLRQSLDQIQDAYIPNHIPKRYRDLPVVIVICIGGDVRENIAEDVKGYTDQRQRNGISFDVWNGDKLADLLLSGILRENALPSNWRPIFRKAVALVDEPDTSFAHFRAFVNSVADACKNTRKARLTAIRQIYIGLWTLFVWARDAKNTESAYLSCEYAVLAGWALVKEHIEGKSKGARPLLESFHRLIGLYEVVSGDYISSYVAPRSTILHGLSAAIPSQTSLDVNLRMFDLLGRVGMRGIWRWFVAERLKDIGVQKDRDIVRRDIRKTAQILIDMVRNNPILQTPIKDDHAIDVNIACLFLNSVGCTGFVKDWVSQIALATQYAFRTDGLYPCVHRDYRDLLMHPKRDDEYRETATAGSLLVPTLALWAALTGDSTTLNVLADFTSGAYRHSNLQLWYPGGDSEEHMYRGSADHGLAATNIRIPRSCEDMVSPIRKECTASFAFRSLSAIERGLWPIVILASRHHRIPVPPHFWPIPEGTTGTNANEPTGE